MKLTMDGIQDRASWNKAGITLPGYDVKAVSEKSKKRNPCGCTLASAIFSAFSSAALLTACWKAVPWTGDHLCGNL